MIDTFSCGHTVARVGGIMIDTNQKERCLQCKRTRPMRQGWVPEPEGRMSFRKVGQFGLQVCGVGMDWQWRVFIPSSFPFTEAEGVLEGRQNDLFWGEPAAQAAADLAMGEIVKNLVGLMGWDVKW